MPSTFHERIDELKTRVGEGTIKSRCVVDQAYAQNQHENTSFVHRHGGGPFYLSAPLEAGQYGLLETVAQTALDDIEAGMIIVSETMSGWVATFAPIGLGNDGFELRTSGHAIVERNGMPVYDRPGSPRRPEGLPHS